MGGIGMIPRKIRWLVVSLAFGTGFWLLGWLVPPGPMHMAFKGAGVATLALYALDRSTSATRPIAMVMVLGAVGDVLIEQDMSLAALAFLVGHCYACWFYSYNRRRLVWTDGVFGALAMLIIPGLTSLAMPGDTGVLAYSCGLAAMVACAWCSRFPRDRVALGAVLFALSDVLLFASKGQPATGALAAVLVWPLYYAGQVLIVLGVVIRSQLLITAPSASRVRRPAMTATDRGRA